MKKGLLIQLMLVICAIAVQAESGYLYTHTAKYKIDAKNYVENGDFSQDYAIGGWADESGSKLNGAVWGQEPYLGPNQEYVIVSIDGSASGTNIAMTNIWGGLPEGLYTISYWVRSDANNNSSITTGASNYIDLFINKTGAKTKDGEATALAEVVNINGDWQQVTYTANIAADDYIVFNASKLASGTMLTGFEIHQAAEVFDTRRADRVKKYMESLLSEEENLPNERELLYDIIDELNNRLDNANVRDNQDIMNEFLEDTDDTIEEFLLYNGATLIGNTLTDWSTWGKANYNSMVNRGTWTFEGGRWGFTGNEEYLEFNAGDGYIASAGIQSGQPALNVGMRTAAGSMDALPAGKYFFSIEAQAVAASNRANPYGANHSVKIIGPSIYVGKDSTVLESDTLNGYYWKTYYKIAEIKEGEEMKVGFHFPVLSGTTGGRYSLRNPKVYQLGISTEELEYKKTVESIIVQQYNLKKRIDEYPIELQDYAWEKDSLQRAITHAQPIYDASLLVIDAEGNVLDKDKVTTELYQELLDEVNALGRARNWVITSNQPISNLQTAIEVAEASLANEANANASASLRTALQTAISEGKTLLASVTSTNQTEEFNAAITKIQTAQEQFEATTANRANPTEIAIKNADFSDFANNNNITATGVTKDWNWTMSASTSRWEIRDNETLSQGHGASIWRGTTVQLDGKAQQTVELAYEGLYEYRAEAYISEERIAELVAAADILETGDTIYKPNIRLFFGVDGKPDSIKISKCYMGVKNDGTYFTRTSGSSQYPGQVYATYSVFFKKTGTAPVTAEFGLEAINNYADAGANGFGFGNNKIYYVGDETQYLADTKADLQTAVAGAEALAAQSESNYWLVKLNRYISDAKAATTAKDMQNALHGLNEISSRVKALGTTTGIRGTHTGIREGQKAGIYTLTGIKVNADVNSLKPGLYIINGKKYFIK